MSSLTVVLVHCRYQQPGGEDAAVDADIRLLESHGHRVVLHERHNDEIRELGAGGRAKTAGRAVWSAAAVRQLQDVVDATRPDVVHVHNTFPLLSPAVYRAANRRGIPVVQTVQNYRMVCADAVLLRDGRICHDCVGRRLPTPGIRHRCYHDSAFQTAVVAAMQVTHRAAGSWSRHVDLYLPCSDHVGRSLEAAGAIPPGRWMTRYNHVAPDPGCRSAEEDQGYVAFAGRLSQEKGVPILLAAAATTPEVPVRIAGDGPQRAELEARAASLPNVTFLGRLPLTEMQAHLRGARCLVVPSVWEEPMGLVLAEAAAAGVPAIASRVGGIPEVVDPGGGELVEPGDAEGLARAMRWAVADAAGWQQRGRVARRSFEQRFGAGAAYVRLVEAYARVGIVIR